MSSGGRHIILTSGTSGRPKGADRGQSPLAAAAALLCRLPYRERCTVVMAAPMFHSWGWLNHRLASLLDTTEVMVPRAGASAILEATDRYRAELVVTTPVAVARLAESGPGAHDLSPLRGVLVSGALIPPDVVERFQARFGPILYSVYGSTEVGLATVADPEQLGEHPDTAGQPLAGVGISVLDEEGSRVPVGAEGEIWVGSDSGFAGYIDGADRPRRGSMVSTGDRGRLDPHGLLFVHGRADDLIISGGENVHPAEVENALRGLAQVADVAAVAVPDETFGQAIRVHVVPAAGVAADELIDLVRARAAAVLAPYQRPRDVVVCSDLPRNATGTVERRLLR
jgi:fatty-acyl-CoA synthase